MDQLLQAIRDEWSWSVPPPRRIIALNKFGNVLVLVDDGSVWRVCPEDLSCHQVADTLVRAAELMDDAGFRDDWDMHRLVQQAEDVHGVLPEGRCFCLKVPSKFGGEYAIGNIGTIKVAEVLAFSGHVGRQIKDLPDGAQVRFDLGT